MIFFDLRKSQDNLERGRLLQTLEGYGEGPKLQGLLEAFLLRQEVVTRQKSFHVPHFLATQGTTQGRGGDSTIISNVAGVIMVRHWLYK